MSEKSDKKTLDFHSSDGTDVRLDNLRGLIPADWQPVDDAEGQAMEAELGEGLPRVRVEESDGTWVGTVIVEASGERLETEECDSHSTVALHLRERLLRYGEELKERAEKIIDISGTGD